MNRPQDELTCPTLPLFKKGKVREVYDFGKQLLIVATDRVSAFDVVLPDLIQDKGRILTQISNFWFDLFKDVTPNHLIATQSKDFPKECKPWLDQLKGRAILVAKTEMLEMESIVRGYLSGSGFKDYKNTGAICGIQLSSGLQNSAKLAQPIFTPSTKASEGHDINVSEQEIKKIVDPKLVDKIKQISLELYAKASEYALERGIIIADTKFEFGLLDGEVILIDEILTPDSSRFWPANDYRPGQNQNSFDKQIIRDTLEGTDWDKTYPGPSLSNEVIERTRARYEEVFEKLTGMSLSAWLELKG